MLLTFCKKYFEYSLLLLISFFSFTFSFSQQIDEGYYNDWNFTPNGVHGNLPLKNIQGRQSNKIVKINDHLVRIQQINPSGVVINTSTLIFKKGSISRFTQTDQWGADYDIENFTKVDNNEFIVTKLTEGVNAYLPCKYGRFIYKNGLLSEVRYYSFKDKLVENQYGYAIKRYKRYSDNFRFSEVQEMSFYNAKGLPVISVDGYHKVVNEFDSMDNKILIKYFGVNDEPIIEKGNTMASTRNYFNQDNNLVKAEFYNLKGALIPNRNGFAIIESQYKNGYLAKELRYDSLHRPTRGFANGDRISIIEHNYDSSGNETSHAYFDERGNPIRSVTGVHKIIYDYSSLNMMIKMTFFDNADNPAINRDSAHTIIFDRDNKGRIIALSNYDIEGNSIKNYIDEVYMLKFKWDEYGRRIETSYWLDSITPMPRWNGTFISRVKYNEDGQAIEYSYFDKDGNAFQTADSSSMQRLTYNADGRIDERQYFYKNNPINRVDGVTTGYHIIKFGYNENGNVNELTFFDLDRKPVNATMWLDDTFDAHRIEFIYKGDRIIEQSFYKLGSDVPSNTINCLQTDFISPDGINIGRKNEN